MAVHASHAALPYPIKGARWSVLVPYLDADGDPTAPATPDTEISKDNGAAADCAEEAVPTSGMDGMALITLSGAETFCSVLALNAKVASGPKATLITAYPRVLPVIFSGSASAGSANTITLATDVPAIAKLLIGCIVATTSGAGGGGASGANNQARVITGFTAARVATVTPDWEVAPDGTTTTYEVYLTEASYARLADVQQWLGTAVATPTTAGIPLVQTQGNIKKNTAFAKFAFLMTDSTTHQPATGKTVSVTRMIDGGAFGAGGLSAVTEVANGLYYVDFAAADLNGDCIVLRATATGCDDAIERILTAK